jgi:hypothetical protein
MFVQYHLSGALDYRQSKTHLAHTFVVPEGATRLMIHFDYTPKQSLGQLVGNDLSLTLFDPIGARGARHNNPDRNIVLSAVEATPGYIQGTLPPGTWTVWVDVHRIQPLDTMSYWFDIETSDEPLPLIEPFPPAPFLTTRGTGWYRGDLHGHSLHSDGKWDVPDLVQYGLENHLDFVTLTDHNTVSGLAQMDRLASGALLTMGGTELTTYYGHALALGVRRWQEWRVGASGLTMPQLAEKVMQDGGLFIIAHPHSIGDPYCTGCNWQYLDMMPGNARCVEIWNSVWDGESGNEKGLRLWYDWLNAGYRMVATAGTDIHRPLTDPRPGFNIVYAIERSEQAILDAIRKGHLYLSAGPQLEFAAAPDLMMGDCAITDTLDLHLRWQGCSKDDCIEIVVNGNTQTTLIANLTGEHRWTLHHPDARWCIATVRSADGYMRAITNPIFMGEGWR